MIRLIETETLAFHEFELETAPDYIILSHRWEEEELTFKDLKKRRNTHKKGWQKVQEFCTWAAGKGLRYAWIDTCNIDKSSSAELSEAINSMFTWYRKAVLCVAYLCDVSYNADPELWKAEFRRSVWFTRGWTLQELLAPKNLLFLSADWRPLASRYELEVVISEITGIQPYYVSNYTGSSVTKPSTQTGSDKYASIAEVMSWASTRKTTRLEDEAYCLMGLFDIHMALLYGEGSNAFLRLQQEIVSRCDDESVFAWHFPEGQLHKEFFAGGLLSTSVQFFRNCRWRPPSYRLSPLTWDARRPPYSMTNKGLHIQPLLMMRFKPHSWDEELIKIFDKDLAPGLRDAKERHRACLMPLNCWVAPSDKQHSASRAALRLRLDPDGIRATRDYAVILECSMGMDENLFERRSLYVPQETIFSD